MNWNNVLQAATSHDAVIAVINEFLAAMDPKFWSQVPPAAHPESVDSPADVHRWHHELVQQLRRSKPASLQLQELCVFFLRASVRLHQLDLREADGGKPSNDEMGCAPLARRPHRLAER
jgi:hypothetical protein